jgi:hypothetical protein
MTHDRYGRTALHTNGKRCFEKCGQEENTIANTENTIENTIAA